MFGHEATPYGFAGILLPGFRFYLGCAWYHCQDAAVEMQAHEN
jgi:hypothetical protein